MLAIPRPDADNIAPAGVVSAPSEAAFTRVFGNLLPPAEYLTTAHGRLAYYAFPGSVNSTDRFLLIHGVQTPALGLLPLTQRLRENYPRAHFTLVDLPGHGLSDTPLAAHVPALFVLVLDQLLEHLGWAKVHLLGFSFGGCTAAAYAVTHPQRVISLALVAPAGLLRREDFDSAKLEHDDPAEVQRYVVECLEGGDLVVPADWQNTVKNGGVVAEALRQWQMDNHDGHPASVVAIFRDGGVMGNAKVFTDLLATGLPVVAIVGELDGVCKAPQLRDLGFVDVTTVPGADHSLVRTRVPEVAEGVEGFWSKQGMM